MGGLAFYEAVRREGFTPRFLLASGYMAAEVTGGGVRPDVPFLPKPWTLEELATKVRELLDRPAPLPEPCGP